MEEEEEGSGGGEEASWAGRVEVDAVVEDDAEDGSAVGASLASIDDSDPTSPVEEPWDV